MIEAIPKPNFWRAPTDNDCGSLMQMRYAQWKIASMYASHKELPQKACMVRPMLQRQRFTKTAWRLLLPTYCQLRLPVNAAIAYEVTGDGRVKTTLTYDPVKELGDMPEFGVLFKFNADYDHVQWYGLGPAETYADPEALAQSSAFRESRDRQYGTLSCAAGMRKQRGSTLGKDHRQKG